MYLFISEQEEEFGKLKLALGRTLKHVSNRRELLEILARESQGNSNVVIMSANMELAAALSLAEELRLSHPTVGVLLLRKKIESAVLSQAMSSGIRDVISMGDPEALVVACRRSEEISRRQSLNVVAQKSHRNLGMITAIHGARDGIGSSTIAINLSMALSSTPESHVCLVDALPTCGDIAVRLRIDTNKSWSDLLGLVLVDDEALHSTLIEIKAGLNVLAAPRESSAISFDGNIFVNQVLRPLQEHHSNLIIDTDSRLDSFTREILRIADRIVLCTDLDLASLKNLKIRLKELVSLGLNEERFMLVVNKSDLKVGVNLKDVPELIGLPVTASLPWDSEVTRLSNEGLSMVTEKPRSLLVHSLQHLLDGLKVSATPSDAKGKSRTRRSA